MTHDVTASTLRLSRICYLPRHRSPVSADTMSGRRKPWHSGTHPRTARNLCARWTADPHTLCLGGCICRALILDACTCRQACGLRLDEHPTTRTGRPAKWSAGHAVDGQVGGPYRPEVLACGARAGARRGNRMRSPVAPSNPTTRDW